MIDCVVNLKFTKHGVRIAGMPPYNAKKGKLLEVSYNFNLIILIIEITYLGWNGKNQAKEWFQKQIFLKS